MLWGVVTRTNVDYAELIWEEFVHAINNFFSDVANLMVPTKKPKPHVIPYFQFTKLIICYLGVGTIFTDGPKYNKKYLEMAARKPCQPTTVTDEQGGEKKKDPEAGKSKQPTPAKQSKSVKKKTSKPTPSNKIHKGKRSDHLVDKEDEEEQGHGRHAPVNGVAIREPVSLITRKLPDVERKGKRIVSYEQAAQLLLDLQNPKKKSIKDQYIFQRRTPVTQEASIGPSVEPQDDTFENVVHDTSSPTDSTNDAETVADTEQSNSRIHKLIWDSSSMKNLEDAFTFGDQFINDKSTEEELGKANMESEVESMVTVPIHQASSSVPPLSTPIIDLSPIKLVYTLKNHDLYSKIDKQVNEVVKEAVHSALQAPLHERFRDLSDFRMKEILHDHMFESGSYRSYPDHTTFYEAFELSMQRENNDEIHEALATSCKRHHDYQDPPPQDSDQSKKKKHDSDVFASKQPLGGPPGQVTIQAQYFFNKDLEYLVS
nr:hypothetical protein [Tanacetum cinerariifolium]